MQDGVALAIGRGRDQAQRAIDGTVAMIGPYRSRRVRRGLPLQQIGQQPCRPRRRRLVIEAGKSSGEPMDGVSTITTNIDTWRQLADRATEAIRVEQVEVQPAVRILKVRVTGNRGR